jgi:DNA-binding transcriptional regulator YiaG
MNPKRKKPVGKPWSVRLKALRVKHKLTQAEAAERAGFALRTWISWENKWRKPSGQSARLLYLAFPELKT